MDKITKLPRINQSEVIGLMDAENLSRVHLGLDPLPYLWYKKFAQLSKIGAIKHTDVSMLRTIKDYCTFTRKERREFPFVRETYLLVIRNLLQRVEIERLKKEIQKLEETWKKTRKH